MNDDREQAELARELMQSLTPIQPGFICRECTVQIAWVLERAYGYARDQIATIFEELIATDSLILEAASDVANIASIYRKGGFGFSDLMILAAAQRAGASPLLTFDVKLSKSGGVELLH